MLTTMILLNALRLAYHGVPALFHVPDLKIEASDAVAVHLRPYLHRSPRNYLGRCKACKARVGVLDAVRAVVTYRKPSGARGSMDGIVTASGKVLLQPGMAAVAVCACGHRVALRAVDGVVKPDHVCNARCMSSHGPSCECSCGGRNHGRSFAS